MAVAVEAARVEEETADRPAALEAVVTPAALDKEERAAAPGPLAARGWVAARR